MNHSKSWSGLPTQVASIYGDVLDCECGELEDVRAIDARWQVVWDIAFDWWLDKLVTGTLEFGWRYHCQKEGYHFKTRH